MPTLPKRPSRKQLSDDSIKACRTTLEALGYELLDGTIDMETFADTFRDEMKAEYIRQYVFGIGGLAYMTAEDWQTVANDLEQQYKYAEDFFSEIDDAASQDDEGAALLALFWRFGLYAASAAAVYEFANTLFSRGEGYTQEAWFLDEAITNHCDDCLAYSDMGWVDIGTFPQPGDGTTVCKKNCGCYKLHMKPDGTTDEA